MIKRKRNRKWGSPGSITQSLRVLFFRISLPPTTQFSAKVMYLHQSVHKGGSLPLGPGVGCLPLGRRGGVCLRFATVNEWAIRILSDCFRFQYANVCSWNYRESRETYIISHHAGMYNRTVIRLVKRQCGSPCNVSVFEGGTNVVKQFSEKQNSSKTPFFTDHYIGWLSQHLFLTFEMVVRWKVQQFVFSLKWLFPYKFFY